MKFFKSKCNFFTVSLAISAVKCTSCAGMGTVQAQEESAAWVDPRSRASATVNELISIVGMNFEVTLF